MAQDLYNHTDYNEEPPKPGLQRPKPFASTTNLAKKSTLSIIHNFNRIQFYMIYIKKFKISLTVNDARVVEVFMVRLDSKSY